MEDTYFEKAQQSILIEFTGQDRNEQTKRRLRIRM